MKNKALILLELRKLWGINELRYCRDRRGYRIIKAVEPLLLSMLLAFYIGAVSLGLVQLGFAAEKLETLILLALSSLMLMLGFFRTGAQLFSDANSDILISMPVSPSQIISARWLRLYIENLPLSLIPLTAVQIVLGSTAEMKIGFYILPLLSGFFLPLMPIALSGLMSIMTERISSGRRNRVILSSVLSLTEFMIIGALFKLLPIFILKLSDYLVYWALSIMMSSLMSRAAAKAYYPIHEGRKPLSVQSGAGLDGLRKEKLYRALLIREWKQYLSHGNYVVNTVIGPFLTAAVSIGMLFVDFTSLGLPEKLENMLPFLTAMILAMMNPTACAISIEGRNWWILKSMPVSTEDVVKAKLSMGLTLPLISALISGALLIVRRHESIMHILSCLLVPAAGAVFSAVWGLSANFRFPNFRWEDDIEVVKQGTAALAGGLAPALIILACGAAADMLPDWGSMAMALILLAASGRLLKLLYRKKLPDLY